METPDLDHMMRDHRRISVQMEQYANGTLAQTDITAVQSYVLLHVLGRGAGGTSLTAIHREFGYSMAHLSTTLKELRKKGYVRMESCARDDRCKVVLPTEKGERMGEYLASATCAVRQRLYDGFSPEELEVLDRMQRRMLQNLSKQTGIKENGRLRTHENSTASTGAL